MRNHSRTVVGWSIAVVALLTLLAAGLWANDFDHGYATYVSLLRQNVSGPHVDYAALKANRAVLDDVVAQFASPAARGEPRWTREQRMAFWVSAYNVFTVRAVVDHYPIQAGWFTLYPRDSIRQIDGVWTELKWQAAGRTVTLDFDHIGALLGRAKFLFKIFAVTPDLGVAPRHRNPPLKGARGHNASRRNHPKERRA